MWRARPCVKRPLRRYFKDRLFFLCVWFVFALWRRYDRFIIVLQQLIKHFGAAPVETPERYRTVVTDPSPAHGRSKQG